MKARVAVRNLAYEGRIYHEGDEIEVPDGVTSDYWLMRCGYAFTWLKNEPANEEEGETTELPDLESVLKAAKK